MGLAWEEVSYRRLAEGLVEVEMCVVLSKTVKE